MTEHNIPFEAHGWAPEHTVFPVSSVNLRIGTDEHPFVVNHRGAIASNWAEEKAAHPAYFDGQVVLHRQLSIRDGAIVGEGHMVPFSAYLWWRRQAGLAGACQIFGMAVPISSDGAVIAIRMGLQTANPGMVYCAAGSLDAHDITDGVCDVHANMQREVMEETGFDLTTARADPQLYGSRWQRLVNVFRLYHFDMTADEMLERIAEHMKTDPEQEIQGGVAIRSADPTAHHYNKAMAPMLAMFFEGKR